MSTVGFCKAPHYIHSLVGTEFVLSLILFPLHLTLFSFAVHHLRTLDKKAAFNLRTTSILYQISACCNSFANFFEFVIAKPLQLAKYFPYCQIIQFLLWMSAITAYIFLQFFWYNRLVAVFDNSTFQLPKLLKNGLRYGIYCSCAYFIPLGLVISFSSRCRVHVIPIDGNIFHTPDSHLYRCEEKFCLGLLFGNEKGWNYYAMILLVSGGTVAVFFLNVIIAYSYVIRMIQTVQNVRRKSNAHIRNNTFAHIRKSVLVAVTSIASSLTFFFCLFSYTTALVNIDLFLNAMLILCPFRFGEKLYFFLFYYCNKFNLMNTGLDRLVLHISHEKTQTTQENTVTTLTEKQVDSPIGGNDISSINNQVPTSTGVEFTETRNPTAK
ncbi:hypothetical protein RFI_32463 [Reticulomyxa filosa]|uniref:G-protein coupled receptors family 1 profile domain-containing protein n=1 Tax=Reticulomyxa filosa TaxID=46433 RepID=X6LUX6_RETFI|nr:hypothetical protein RFI_32463 [Reticulomyxa filosa]|eukprot:ETO04932.1 hypothetical protein RFI_32463 [Reticulomyxa filosa]